jgi:predicted transcriptional regulator
VKYYQLTVPFSQIVKILEEDFLKDNKEKLIALKRLREIDTMLQT